MISVMELAFKTVVFDSPNSELANIYVKIGVSYIWSVTDCHCCLSYSQHVPQVFQPIPVAYVLTNQYTLYYQSDNFNCSFSQMFGS